MDLIWIDKIPDSIQNLIFVDKKCLKGAFGIMFIGKNHLDLGHPNVHRRHTLGNLNTLALLRVTKKPGPSC